MISTSPVFLDRYSLAPRPHSSSFLPAPPADWVPSVSSDEDIRAALHDPRVIVLDVRRPDEFALDGCAGSLNIPHLELGKNADRLPGDKSAPIVAFCRAGVRVRLALYVLQQLGFTNLVNGTGITRIKPIIDAEPGRYIDAEGRLKFRGEMGFLDSTLH